MQTLPREGSGIILQFRCLFSKKVFDHVVVLVVGTLLAVGRRTVCAALRFAGLSDEKRFHKYHRVLSLVKWSALKASRILLSLLIKCFCTEKEPLVFGLDETIERRRGTKIKAKGIYRDPVRSSHSHFVKCSGLRWMSLMLLVNIPWAGRIWALPFLSALAPSERYCKEQGKPHKKITDWARQMIFQLSRWLKDRLLIVVADSSYAVVELLSAVKEKVSFITRLRLDAALYEPAPPRVAGQLGRSRLKGPRQPTLKQRLTDPSVEWRSLTIAQWYGEKNKALKVASGTAIWYHSGLPPVRIKWVLIKDEQTAKAPAALLSTNTGLSEEQVILYFIRRWSMEATFQEVRTHLGVETQRQWTDRAITCTTPSLMALFSLVALWADQLHQTQKLTTLQAAWYKKELPTFCDALHAVRNEIWQQNNSYISTENEDMIKIPRHLFTELTALLCRAA
jgi:DDE superfamily endonuclease